MDCAVAEALNRGPRGMPGVGEVSQRVILVVEDDPDVRELLERVLTLNSGGRFVVETVASAPEALSRIGARDYALILTDFRMPRADGVDLARAVRGRHPRTPTMIVTAYPDDEKVHAASRRGDVNRVFAKPWRIVDLMEAIEALTRTGA